VAFVSAAAEAEGVGEAIGLAKRTVAVRDCRAIRKADMIHNGAQPRMEVDPQTYEVRADGELLTCEPAEELPLTQRYFLF
jgi:urease subunit alpha